MNIIDYKTAGGKNLIMEYFRDLQTKERAEAYKIRQHIRKDGMDALETLNTRQLKSKLWEIKFFSQRIMYVLYDKENIYFLHVCKKQKGKAEKFELDKAIKRAKDAGLKVD